MQDRLVYGVPWGTLIVVSVVLVIYLFVQDGWSRWQEPVFIPFVNWSYLYPTGVVFGAFTHANEAHLLGNLTAALVLGTLSEYYWGHYPPDQRRTSVLSIPWVRAVLIFPGVVGCLGVVTSLFAWGAVIGFSGVVFAFAGFAVLRYPLLTLVALTVRSAIREIGRAIAAPVVVTDVAPTVSPPAWAGVAVQGHLLGFLLGAFLAVLLFYYRSDAQPRDPMRVWVGVLVAGTILAMWAIGTSPGEHRYVLYRGAGIAMLAVMAIVLAWAATASPRSRGAGITDRHLAIVILAIPLLAMVFVAVPLNLVTVSESQPAPASVAVGDYTVGYSQNASVGITPVIEFPGAADMTGQYTNGVIIASSDRHLWTRASTSGNLAVDRSLTIRLGGIGWREDVTITRDGWVPVGGEPVYRVTLAADGDQATFTAPSQAVDGQVHGQTITLEATETDFLVTFETTDGDQHQGTVPPTNESTDVGPFELEHVEDRLMASVDGTRLLIAEREESATS